MPEGRPKRSVGSAVGELKDGSVPIPRGWHPEWRKTTGRNRTLWAKGYYVSTVGLNESVIVKRMRHQGGKAAG